MDDVDAFVSGVFEVDLDPDRKLTPTAARQMKRRLADKTQSEQSHESLQVPPT